jgi:hypothetical protein
MEKSKQHSYLTRRNKAANFEENENPGKKSPALSRIKNGVAIIRHRHRHRHRLLGTKLRNVLWKS